MNRLCGTRTYLCGAMDREPDGGVGWRLDIAEFLEERGVVVIDPCDKPIDIGIEDSVNRERINELKAEGKYDEICETKIVRHVDLRAVDITDYMIVNVDMEGHPCGTYEELFWANREKKPILIHLEQGKQNTPNWLFWAIPHQHIFDTWDDLKGYLDHVDTAETYNHYKRWMFFDLGKPTLSALLMAAENDVELANMIEDWYLRQQANLGAAEKCL